MIKESYMNLDLKAQTKNEVIEELAKQLDNAGVVNDLEKLIEDIKIRESLSTTGIGFKIALPHAKSKYIKEPAIAFGKSIEGIDYDSMDGVDAHLFFLICMPEDGGNLHLKALAKLSRNLIHESFREALDKAQTKAEVSEVLKDIDKEDKYV
jgi:fructose-specific phosphotransferase system IIA component